MTESKPKLKLELTPTQERLLGVLSDGQPHSADKLLGCLNDELADRRLLHVHLCYLRKKLLPFNHGILVQFIKQRVYYRRIIFYTPPLEQSCFQEPLASD